MASIERTAYPRFPNVLASSDIQKCYTPTSDEFAWVGKLTRGSETQLCALVLLKCFEQLHHFPALDTIPPAIIDHIAAVQGLPRPAELVYKSSQTLYRHHAAIRKYLGVTPFEGPEARKLAIRIAREAAQVADLRADIINATIDELISHRYELPAFSTLGVCRTHLLRQDELAASALRAAASLIFSSNAARLVS